MSLLFSKLISLSVLILVALPFGLIYTFSIGFATLNISEVLYIAIVVFSIILAAINGLRRRFAILLLLWVSISGVYLFFSPLIWGVSISQSLAHYRLYLPFFAAIMILVAPIEIDLEKFTKLLILAAAISAGLALLINFVLPEIIEKSFKDSEESLTYILGHGRLYWRNGLIVFFVLGMFFSASGRTGANIISLLFVMFAILAMMNRTIFIGLAFMFLVIFFFNRQERLFRRIGLALAMLIIIFVVFSILYEYSEKFSALVDVRFFGGGDFSSVYETDIVSRYFLYEHYSNSLGKYFPIGQGLGRPILTGQKADVFITDISLLSFVLPFGIIGLWLFFYFLYTLYKAIRDYNAISNHQKSVKKILPIVLLALLITSLNIDVFSRDSAVVWFAILVSIICGRKKKLMSGSSGC